MKFDAEKIATDLRMTWAQAEMLPKRERLEVQIQLIDLTGQLQSHLEARAKFMLQLKQVGWV